MRQESQNTPNSGSPVPTRSNDVLKSLRRLKIHFPNYGQGYLYLLLRHYNLDCCEVIDALSTKTIPQRFEKLSIKLELEEVRYLIDQFESSHSETEESVQHSNESYSESDELRPEDSISNVSANPYFDESYQQNRQSLSLKSYPRSLVHHLQEQQSLSVHQKTNPNTSERVIGQDNVLLRISQKASMPKDDKNTLSLLQQVQPTRQRCSNGLSSSALSPRTSHAEKIMKIRKPSSLIHQKSNCSANRKANRNVNEGSSNSEEEEESSPIIRTKRKDKGLKSYVIGSESSEIEEDTKCYSNEKVSDKAENKSETSEASSRPFRKDAGWVGDRRLSSERLSEHSEASSSRREQNFNNGQLRSPVATSSPQNTFESPVNKQDTRLSCRNSSLVNSGSNSNLFSDSPSRITSSKSLSSSVDVMKSKMNSIRTNNSHPEQTLIIEQMDLNYNNTNVDSSSNPYFPTEEGLLTTNQSGISQFQSRTFASKSSLFSSSSDEPTSPVVSTSCKSIGSCDSSVSVQPFQPKSSSVLAEQPQRNSLSYKNTLTAIHSKSRQHQICLLDEDDDENVPISNRYPMSTHNSLPMSNNNSIYPSPINLPRVKRGSYADTSQKQTTNESPSFPVSGLPIQPGHSRFTGNSRDSYMKTLERRKEQSQQIRSLQDMTFHPPTPIDMKSKDQSAYTDALECFLIKENLVPLTKRLPKELIEGEIKEAPYPEAHGFRWLPSKRRYIRCGGLNDVSPLRPRHRLLVGPSIYQNLYDYQKAAVAWMFELFKLRAGGILGDEMGLGKTVQTATFLRCLFSSKLATSCLILLPLTLFDQWKSHLRTWCPSAEVSIYHGSKQERRCVFERFARAYQPVVVLTTYETFRNSTGDLAKAPQFPSGDSLLTKMEIEAQDPSQIEEAIVEEDSWAEETWRRRICDEIKKNKDDEGKPWDVVILDEAHKIKNPRNQLSQAVRGIVSSCRIALTGTPVSSKLDELWALMDFCNPGLLGNQATFKREFADPIKEGSARNAADFCIQRKNQIASELRALVKPYILRRTVEGTLGASTREGSVCGDASQVTSQPPTEVVSQQQIETRSLPPKTDIIVWLDLTEDQYAIYSAYLEGATVKRIFKQSEVAEKGMNSLRAVSVLLKLCRHPVFLLPHEMQTWREEIGEQRSTRHENELEDCEHHETWFNKLQLLRQTTIPELLHTSRKLQFLSTALPGLHANGHRCLIFSQSTMMLDLIERTVMNPLDLTFLRIDGKVSGELRHQRLKQFRNQPHIFAVLMTTKVGGVGLNLTIADRVIIVDPDWTPANDNQAVARTYRIGQTKEVIIYRLFTAGAIEDHAFRLQIFKQGIAKTALENANQKTYFSTSDMRQIFTLRQQRDSETLKIVESVNEKNSSSKDLSTIIMQDLGNAFSKVKDIFCGLSDYDELYKTLENQISPSQEVIAKVKSSTSKLKEEEYDETQMMDFNFIHKGRPRK